MQGILLSHYQSVFRPISVISSFSYIHIVNMEKLSELKLTIGEENLFVLIEEIENGKISKDLLKMMALKMGGTVHGVFEQKQELSRLEHVARQANTVKHLTIIL